MIIYKGKSLSGLNCLAGGLHGIPLENRPSSGGLCLGHMMFKVGDEVQCVSDPSRIGTVVEIRQRHDDIQYYRVNFGPTGRPIIPEDDLRPYVVDTSPYTCLADGKIDGYLEFQRLMTFQRLVRTNPLRNNIYAFNASRTRFFPYQFKPLLKFLDSPKNRLLIADEVGLGKTIEAGLILSELKARQTIHRALIVCPSNLTRKWEMELKKRFGEKFQILKVTQFLDHLREYESDPDNSDIQGIISLESIRNDRVLEELDALAPSFDVVIVDEAHHMRNFGRKQRRAGVLLSRSSDVMLMLTATPIHLGNENLFSLLNIMDEEEFPDFMTVDDRFRKNEPIVKAQICMGQIPPNVHDALSLLDKASESSLIRQNPVFNELMDFLHEIESNGSSSADGRSLQILAQRALAELNLIGHVFTRTKKRDVHTGMAIRQAYPLRLRFTDLEKVFYEAVTDYVLAESESRTSSPLIRQWILNTPQRRMASSIPAMVEYYRDNLGLETKDVSEDFDLDDEDFDDTGEHGIDLSKARERLRTIVARWPINGPDSKYNSFISILRELRKKEGRLKVMVFAFFKDTLRYLKKRLSDDGFVCDIISGDIDPSTRSEIVDNFHEDETFEILLSSKVGSEGLDFQFSDIMFNYDLPWNPMEVEQRIGRLDRIGQDSEVIRIYNFWIEGTIEERILLRLYMRIGIFERSIGELEMILGDEISTLERDILSKKLSQEDLDRLIEQKALVIEKRRVDLEKLEKQSAHFIGTDQFFNEEVEMIQKRRRYVTGEQMRRFVVDFLKKVCPRSRLEYDSKGDIGKLYPDDILRTIISRYGSTGDATKLLSPSNTGIPITFDSQVAFDQPKLEFINVLHPLTQSVTTYYSEEDRLHSFAHHVVLKTDILPKGLYVYFIYRLRVTAARNSNTLEMVILDQNNDMACNDEKTEILLGEMVEKGEDPRGTPYEINPKKAQASYDRATDIFLARVRKIRDQAEKNNEAFINRRMESLRLSYGKIIKSKKELLDQSIQRKRKERYLRMLEGTIRRLNIELTQKERDLDQQRIVQVEYDEIAAGILEII